MFGKMGQMGNIIKQAQKAQKELQEVQNSFKTKEFEKDFAQGNVTLKMDGEFNVKSLKINPDFVDPSSEEEMEMLEDSIAAAFNNMYKEVDTYRSERLQKVTAGLPMDALGDMGGLLK